MDNAHINSELRLAFSVIMAELAEGADVIDALGIRKDYLRRITETGHYRFERDDAVRTTIYRGSRVIEQVEVQPMPKHSFPYIESESVYCEQTTNDGMCAHPDTCPANPNYKPRHRKDV